MERSTFGCCNSSSTAIAIWRLWPRLCFLAELRFTRLDQLRSVWLLLIWSSTNLARLWNWCVPRLSWADAYAVLIWSLCDSSNGLLRSKLSYSLIFMLAFCWWICWFWFTIKFIFIESIENFCCLVLLIRMPDRGKFFSLLRERSRYLVELRSFFYSISSGLNSKIFLSSSAPWNLKNLGYRMDGRGLNDGDW